MSYYLGHEYPYAIKMKQIKATNHLTCDSEEHLANNNNPFYSSPRHHHSTASLNTISNHSHDFELRKRDLLNAEHSSKKLRFFHKRKTKDFLMKLPLQPPLYDDPFGSSSSSTAFNRTKSSMQFFGLTLDELMKRYNDQLPPVIQVEQNRFD